ncbi:MAG: ThiF family adenylyltransferase [Alphaproteobacteria bacterium]|nr:ThiF family adenylyltransferase [Alphaproteobacteria bacterium]
MLTDERYSRHLALPDFSVTQQEMLARARILVVGAGGLGAAALPALAGAGVGHITIVDHDTISRSNLHRQTIYRDADVGQGKAEKAADYLRALNPEIEVEAVLSRFQEADLSGDFALVLDGTDNFAAKIFLNDWAVENAVPLVSASVHQFKGQAGVFAGHRDDAPCYRCLFPDLPEMAPDCSTAGVLGTASGMMGLLQAHMALLYMAGLGDIKPGDFLQMDFLNFRLASFHVPKDTACKACGDKHEKIAPVSGFAPLVALSELPSGTLIVDVREAVELEADPIPGALHIPLMTIPERMDDLPQDRPLAFVCAGNVRSRHAADYLTARGFTNIFVLDKFSL